MATLCSLWLNISESFRENTQAVLLDMEPGVQDGMQEAFQ